MTYAVTIETVAPRQIAAVRSRVAIPDIAAAWKPALDQVWAFLAAHEELRVAGGHNVFLYHHPTQRDQPMDIDFGVGVARPFTGEGAVQLAETPAGQVARTLHVGSYMKLPGAHQAVHAWCAQNGKRIGGASWEAYGDWADDESKLETEIFYLLA